MPIVCLNLMLRFFKGLSIKICLVLTDKQVWYSFFVKGFITKEQLEAFLLLHFYRIV